MKCIIAGCRDIHDPEAQECVEVALHNSGWRQGITEVVSGDAPGIDKAGTRWGFDMWLSLKRFPADWKKHGRAAGPIRNREMAEYADRLIAIWDGKSRGTKNMIETMRSLGKPVYVHLIERAKYGGGEG